MDLKIVVNGLTLSYEDAKQLYELLDKIFGRRVSQYPPDMPLIRGLCNPTVDISEAKRGDMRPIVPYNISTTEQPECFFSN